MDLGGRWMRLWHEDLIGKLPRPQLLGNTVNVVPLEEMDGARSTQRWTMCLLIARMCFISTIR